MKKDKNHQDDIDLKNYQDASGVSLREMNFGLWLAENRRRITKAIIIFLILLSAGFFIYSSYSYFIYFVKGQSGKLSNEISLLSPRKVFEELEISSVQVFAVGERVDLAVKIKNPNEKFLANFNYCFTQEDREIACASGFILPNEEKYILDLGREAEAKASFALLVKDIFWQRLNAHQIPDWDKFFDSRLNFSFADIVFSNSVDNSLAKRVDLNMLQFAIKNSSAYSYYEVPLDIMLYSGSELVGVHRYVLNQFLTGETRSVKVTWPGRVTNVSRVDIQPRVNIIDEHVYLKYQGGPQ